MVKEQNAKELALSGRASVQKINNASIFSEEEEEEEEEDNKNKKENKEEEEDDDDDDDDLNLDLDYEDIDITNDDIDFSELDGDLKKFQADPMVKDALLKGVDLRQYAQSIEKQLQTVERDSINDYIQEKDSLLLLHSQIEQCDLILETMEAMLGGFKTSLGSISEEIKQLQEESLTMNMKLSNRKGVENKLASFVEQITISPQLIRVIMNAEITEDFIPYLAQLHKLINFTKEVKAMACKDVENEITRLAQKATAKVRNFLLTKIDSLKKTNTNVQIIQEKVLLPFKYLNVFLMADNAEIADEILRIYIDTVSKIFFNHLKRYSSSIMKLQLEVVTNMDLIGVQDTQLKGFFTSKISRTTTKGSVFVLGTRKKNALDDFGDEAASVGRNNNNNNNNNNDTGVVGTTSSVSVSSLATGENNNNNNNNTGVKNSAPSATSSSVSSSSTFTPVPAPAATSIVLAHVAESSGTKYPIEILYKSMNQLLVDAVTSEFLFDLDFFGRMDLFTPIFEKTIHHYQELLQESVLATHDAIGILLMIIITHKYQLIMTRRRVPSLESYFDGLNTLLWPRFKQIFDLNLKSIREANARQLFKDEHPHYITRRYAEFASSIYVLNYDFGNDMLQRDMALLQKEMEKFLHRLSLEHPNKQKSVVFVINNYDLILSVFREHDVAADDCAVFEKLLQDHSKHFVEHELSNVYGKLVEFVNKTEAVLDNQSVEDIKRVNPKLEDETRNVVADFTANWKAGLEQINTNILANFSNYKCGVEILKESMMYLCQYYQRFYNIIQKLYKHSPWAKDVLPMNSIMYEIKKYGRAY